MVLRNNIDDLLSDLAESRFERGKGSSAGRAKMKDSKQKFNPEKAKVRVYPSIKKAIQHGKYGDIFSTDTADRLYVVTKPTWGDKSTQTGNKVAKGFTPGSATPNANWKSIQGYSKRTKKKHGGVRTTEAFSLDKDKSPYERGREVQKKSGWTITQGMNLKKLDPRISKIRKKVIARHKTRQQTAANDFDTGMQHGDMQGIGYKS